MTISVLIVPWSAPKRNDWSRREAVRMWWALRGSNPRPAD